MAAYRIRLCISTFEKSGYNDKVVVRLTKWASTVPGGGGGGICHFVLSRAPLGSVSSRECLDAPAILATFTAGRTGLVMV